MRRTALILALCAVPATAQSPDAPAGDDVQEGLSMIEEGARRFLDGLTDEVAPQMRSLAEALNRFHLGGLGIENPEAYAPPEMLPNGDIILRRRTPLPDAPPEEVPEGDEFDI